MSDGMSINAPWVYQEDSDAYTHIVRDAKNNIVLSAPQDATGKGERDARMASALPDLITGARLLIELLEHPSVEHDSTLPQIVFLKMAIAKAEGRQS